MKSRYVIGTAVIVVAFLVLVSSSMRSNTLQAMSVSAVRAADSSERSYIGQRLRIGGFVAKVPVRSTPVKTVDGIVTVHHFMVEEGKARIAVSYRDVLPDTFRPGGPVQVDGIYAAPGEVQADRVLTKCPSKYQSEEVYERTEAAKKASKF